MLYVPLHDAKVMVEKASLMGVHGVPGIKEELTHSAISHRRIFLLSKRCQSAFPVVIKWVVSAIFYAMILYGVIQLARNYENIAGCAGLRKSDTGLEK